MMDIEKKKFWIEKIKDYKSSGLTAAKWCEKNEISIHVLRNRIYQINKDKKKHAEKQSKWTAVMPAKSTKNSKTSDKPLNVIIGKSIIEVVPGFDPDTFRSVVRILSEQC